MSSREYHRAYSRRWRQDKRRVGRCPRCGDPNTSEYYDCEACRDVKRLKAGVTHLQADQPSASSP